MNSTNWPLKGIDAVLETDVMLGRGRGTNFHAGNKRYRAIVEKYKDKYSVATRIEKPMIALEIVNQVRAWSPPGRFLKCDKTTGKWSDVGDKKAREKTSQALREPKQGEPKQEEGIQRQQAEEKRKEMDSSNSCESSCSSESSVSSNSTQTQMEQEGVETEQPDLERNQSVGTIDLNAVTSNFFDSESLDLGSPDDVRSTAQQFQNNLLISDQVNKPVGGELSNLYDSKLLAPQNQERKYAIRNGIPGFPPPMPPRAPRAQGFAPIKRETSNQEIFEIAPKAKKRAICCELKRQTTKYLKELFVEKVLRDEMPMEAFLVEANQKMAQCPYRDDSESPSSMDVLYEGSKIRPSTERMTSDDFALDLSFFDVCHHDNEDTIKKMGI